MKIDLFFERHDSEQGYSIDLIQRFTSSDAAEIDALEEKFRLGCVDLEQKEEPEPIVKKPFNELKDSMFALESKCTKQFSHDRCDSETNCDSCPIYAEFKELRDSMSTPVDLKFLQDYNHYVYCIRDSLRFQYIFDMAKMPHNSLMAAVCRVYR